MRFARAIPTLSVFVLLSVLALDVATSASLVVGILLTVPIALSTFVGSRRFTLALVGGALAANVVAGVMNAAMEGSVDATALLNRGLSMLACVLVGALTLAVREASARGERLEWQERRTAQERALRDLVASVSGPLTAEQLVERAARGLRALLRANVVTIGAVKDGRLTAPFASDGHDVALTSLGERVPSEFTLRPNREPPIARTANDRVLLGRWRRRDSPELLVLASGTREDDALLGEALAALEPLLEQTVLLENVREQRVELERRHAVIRDLVYAFSHDLRTPLMANAMMMRLALSGAYGELPAEFRTALENGVSANQDLLDLAEKLLLVAKLESGELTTDTSIVRLRDVVRRRAGEVRATLEARGVRLALTLDVDGGVRGDAGELRRVVQNLLDNAGRFAPRGSTVEVRLDARRGSAVLQVVDRGPGVPPEFEPRLFQRFRGSGAGAGSGLGLYLARSIVEAHGGTLTYRRVDDRSVFEVTLPLEEVAQGRVGSAP